MRCAYPEGHDGPHRVYGAMDLVWRDFERLRHQHRGAVEENERLREALRWARLAEDPNERGRIIKTALDSPPLGGQ